jgi:hypothetical protein
MGKLGKKASDVDVILDFGAIEERSAARNAEVAKLLLQRLPLLIESRSLVVSATSFPSDLSRVQGIQHWKFHGRIGTPTCA